MKHRLTLSLLTALFMFGIFVPAFLVTSGQAAADATWAPTDAQVKAATVTWINRAEMTLHIAGKDITLTDGDIGDTDYNYEAPAGTSKCTMQVNVSNINKPAQVTLNIQAFPAGAVQGNCSGVKLPNNANVTAGNPGGSNVIYNWQDSNTIGRTDGNSSWTFVYSGKTNSKGQKIFLKTSENGKACQDTMLVSPDNSSEQLWVMDSGGNQADETPVSSQEESLLAINNQSCYSYGLDGHGGQASGTTSGLGNQQNATKQSSTPAGSGSGSGQQGGDSTPAAPSINCSVKLFNPLSWFLCPMAVGLEAVAGQLDNAINSALNVNMGNWQKQYMPAWQAVRNISLGLIAIAGLVAVVSQAAGLEFLDAYTIRKVLPRILIVAIGISLSWPLLQWFVTFTNDLGHWIGTLIYAAATNPAGGTQNVELGGGGTAVIGLIGAAGIASLGFVGLLSFAGTAALAASVGFLVLTLRQMIIIMLVIFAPVALVCYVLPNTQRLWKLWWESFSKGLLMFPMITGLIALGRVFAADTSTGANSIEQVMAFVAYFAPYFLIPFTFRLAGGAIGTIGGFVNDRHKGAFDRLKGYRSKTSTERMGRLKQGSLYQDRGVGKVLNNVGRRVGVGARGRFGVGRTGRAALATATLANNEEALRNNGMLRELRNNDDANAVLGLSGGTAAGAREAARDLFGGDTARAERALAAAGAVGYNRQNAAAAMQTMAQNKSRAVRAGDVATVQRGVLRLANGNAQEAENLEHNYQYFSREAGRGDLGGAWQSQNVQARGQRLATTLQAAAAAAGAPISNEEASEQAMRHVTALDGIGRTEVPSMVRGYPAQMRQYADTIRTMMDHGNPAERAKAAQHLLEMQKALPYASDDNKDTINNLVKHYVNYADNTSIEDQLAAASGVRGLTGLSLSRAARVYDRETGQQNFGPGAGAVGGGGGGGTGAPAGH